ncbi:MAG: OmpA family protein [Vicinamibacterales bacterium]
MRVRLSVTQRLREPRSATRLSIGTWLAGLLMVASLAVPADTKAQAQPAQDPDTAERTDFLTFAQGAMPVRIGGAGAALGADYEAAVRIVDGDPAGFIVVNRAPADADTEFVYELPALTTFDRFAVGDVMETPSPTTTFTRLVEIHGSATGPNDGFVLLARAGLETHARRGLRTEIPVIAATPVRWVKVRLVGGINVMQERSFFEFSEIIGNGTQAVPELATTFSGTWRNRALTLDLVQDGPLVSGCYDGMGLLTGTVTGNLLRATGVTPAGIPSAFLLNVTPEGDIRGVRSTNGSPFRLTTLPVDAAGAGGRCAQPPPPTLGCGSVIHGITFAFDSADIRPDSEPVLQELYEGLRGDGVQPVVIEGHTSSEGSDAYNLALSERRAQAVLAALVARGLPAARLSAAGLGESRPMATNADESGRSLNRRVEIRCQ